MKHFGLLAVALFVGGGAALAAPAQQFGIARVKRVKVYPQGVYVTMSVKASLKGVPQERVLFPDLWYADRETVEIRLVPTEQSEGVVFVPEVSPATQVKNVSMYRQRVSRRDVKLEALGRLRSDSMAIEREIDFLKAQTAHAWKSPDEAKIVEKWIRERFPDLYERQRRICESIGEQNELLAEDRRVIESIGRDYSRVTLVWVRVEAPGPREVEFELSYYTDAAEWKPIYYFRFDPERQQAELDYQATVRQWTGFDWNEVETALSYGTPKRLSQPKRLYRQTAGYRPAVPVEKKRRVDILDLDVEQSLAVDVTRFGGTYVAEAELAETEADVSYLLPEPLSLVYSADGAQTYQTATVYKDTIPASYDYEATPKISDKVLMMARIPDWQRLRLRGGRMNVFYDGRMLGQSDLSVNTVEDTLSIPLTEEPRVAVERSEVKNYEKRVSRSEKEQSRVYEIRIRNNRDFPVNLTVKDQYPVASTDKVEVSLTESSGAQADADSGMLTWKLQLDPGEERILRFGYSVRYPKDGTVYF